MHVTGERKARAPARPAQFPELKTPKTRSPREIPVASSGGECISQASSGPASGSGLPHGMHLKTCPAIVKRSPSIQRFLRRASPSQDAFSRRGPAPARES